MVEPSFHKFLCVFDPLNVFHGPHVNGLIEAVPMVWVSIFLIFASASVVFGRYSAFDGHHVTEHLKKVKIGMTIDFMVFEIGFGRHGIIGVRSHPETHFQPKATPQIIEITKSIFRVCDVTFGRTHL